MAHICVIGSINMDICVETKRWPQPGETVFGDKLTLNPGGKGANQAVAASRLGAEVYMVGCVGDDMYGKAMLEALTKSGVKTDYVSVIPYMTTGTAHITISEGDNTIVVIRGANWSVTPEVVDRAWEKISTASMVLLQHEIPKETIGYVIGRCHEAGVPVLLNPAPFMDIPEAWKDKLTYITPNEHEAALLFAGHDRDEILKERAGQVIMTVGADGVLYGDNGRIEHVECFHVPVVDTTGAGDTFNGAFAAATVEGQPMKEAIRFANAAAALSIGKLGAQSGMPWKSEVEELLRCRK